jgi:hypothetical protein
MNNDSIFESEFFIENKGYIIVFTTVTLAFATIWWLYRGLKTTNNTQNSNNQNNQNNQLNDLTNINNFNMNLLEERKTKKRLTISANDLLFKDINNMDNDVSELYQLLDSLSKQFDIYLIFFINDNDDQEIIIKSLAPLIEDNIVYKHVNI